MDMLEVIRRWNNRNIDGSNVLVKEAAFGWHVRRRNRAEEERVALKPKVCYPLNKFRDSRSFKDVTVDTVSDLRLGRMSDGGVLAGPSGWKDQKGRVIESPRGVRSNVAFVGEDDSMKVCAKTCTADGEQIGYGRFKSGELTETVEDEKFGFRKPRSLSCQKGDLDPLWHIDRGLRDGRLYPMLSKEDLICAFELQDACSFAKSTSAELCFAGSREEIVLDSLDCCVGPINVDWGVVPVRTADDFGPSENGLVGPNGLLETLSCSDDIDDSGSHPLQGPAVEALKRCVGFKAGKGCRGKPTKDVECDFLE